VVVVDGLRASALGAYGNTTFPTPALDRFAADSCLLDFCFAPSAELREVYRALWYSIAPQRPPAAGEGAPSLPQWFAANGYDTALIADDSAVLSFVAANDFDQRVEVASSAVPNQNERRAEDASQTAIARLFAAACELVETASYQAANGPERRSAGQPRLIWVHSRGMYGPWDAPTELQQSQLDEGDPPPLESITPPEFQLSDADDPDAAFRYSCAYAAQVMILDACWDGLMETLADRLAGKPWLVVLLGARGFPLGEHRQIGGVDHRLYGEQLHVPLLVRFPDGYGRLARSDALASHVDLLPTLAAWAAGRNSSVAMRCDGMNVAPLLSGAKAAWRDALLSTSAAGCQSLRTASWCLRQECAATSAGKPSDDERKTVELYVRPDDRWEANDVAKLCRDVVETLSSAIARASLPLAQHEPLAPRLLPEPAESTGAR
jgi:arylsulfatase A-like enzyme